MSSNMRIINKHIEYCPYSDTWMAMIETEYGYKVYVGIYNSYEEVAKALNDKYPTCLP
jgi:hypothetical protein